MIHGLIALLLVVCSQAFSLSCSTPVTISDPAINVQWPLLSSNAKGDVAIVWAAVKNNGEEYVQIATKMAQDQNWSQPATISALDNEIVAPCCFLDAASNTYAIWLCIKPHDARIPVLFSTKRAGQTWSAERTLTPENFTPDDGCCDDAGRISIIGSYFPGTYPYKRTIRVLSKMSNETQPTALDIADQINSAENVLLDVSATKKVFAIWSEDDGLFYTHETTTNQWAPPAKLCNFLRGENDDFELIVDPFENPAIIWAYSTSRPDSSIILVMTQHNGIWSDPCILSNPRDQAAYPQISVDAQGNLLAVWETQRRGGRLISAAYKPFGQPWSPASDISLPSDEAYCPEVETDENGHFVAIWEETNLNDTYVQGNVFSTKTQAWSTPTQLSPKGKTCCEPVLAFSDAKTGIISWRSTNNRIDWIIQAATLKVED